MGRSARRTSRSRETHGQAQRSRHSPHRLSRLQRRRDAGADRVGRILRMVRSQQARVRLFEIAAQQVFEVGQSMSQTTSEFLLERLKQWGVRRIYGYPGDGINGIMGAFERVEGLEFIQVRHEEMAAFMACAHAKYTGEVGVCLATSGPGAIHLLNGLYDAKLDHQPVVAIVGQASRLAIGGAYQQEVDLQTLFKDVASEFVNTAMAPAQVRHLVDRAVRIALAERTVTCVIIPHDLQEEEMVQPPHAHSTVHSGVGWTQPRVVPSDHDLRRAADVLNAGER